MKELHEIGGAVVQGKQRARLAGFPTLNFALDRPDKALAGVWGGIIHREDYYPLQEHVVVSISGNGKNAEAHIKRLGKAFFNRAPQYGDIVIIGLVVQISAKRGKLPDDVAKLRTCAECMFCLHKDYGYSNWTVVGTTESCFRAIREESEAEDTPLGLTAVHCAYFLAGGCVDEDCDGENPVPDDYLAKVQAKFDELHPKESA